MKIGMPTLIEVPDIIRTVELCKELGLSFIELNMNMPEFCPEKLDYALVKKLSKTFTWLARRGYDSLSEKIKRLKSFVKEKSDARKDE